MFSDSRPTGASRWSFPLGPIVQPLLCILLAACSPQRDATPMPTRQTTIDPVMKKLDAAAEQEQKRREELEAAAKQ
jgi:hypothetical protein